MGGSTDSVSAKSAVEWDKVIPGNPISGSRLVIREFKDAAGPAACVAHAAKLVSPATENLKVVTSDVAADHVTDHIEINVPNVLQQSVLRVAFVHRERYLVWIELYEGKVGAFNGEAKKLSESAKKLIDTRFPK